MTDEIRQITAAVSLCPNYIYHLMAVARAGFDSEYADDFADSIEDEDREFLEQQRSALAFANNTGGELAYVVINLPLRIDLDTPDRLEEYYSLLVTACHSRDFEPFLQFYGLAGTTGDPWPVATAGQLAPLADYEDTLAHIGKIVVRNFARFERSVWPDVSGRARLVAERLNAEYDYSKRIDQWEQVTGVAYAGERFVAELCGAIKNGPNANSICLERVVFWDQTPWSKLVDLVSHEVGTHTIFHSFLDLMKTGEYEQAALYRAYESLAWYYNSLILERLPAFDMPESYREKEHREIYEQMHERKPGLTPTEMILGAMDRLGAS